jgi:hypothetical protein
MASTFKVKHPIYFNGVAYLPGDTFQADDVPGYFYSLDYVEVTIKPKAKVKK